MPYAAQQDLTGFLNLTSLMVTRCSRDLRYLFVTPAYAKMAGRTPEEIIGQPISEVMGEAGFNIIRPYIEQVLNGKTVHYETPVPFKREERWLSVTYSPEKNESGEVIGWVASIIDVTERRMAEQALRDSEGRFRMLADNISQLAWICNSLGVATWYNRRWLDYTGVTLEDAKDWGWKKVHHPDHVERVVAGVQRARERGEAWEDVFPLRSKDGQYRWFLSRAIPIHDDEGNVVRWFGTNTDITEQKQAEDALREANRRKDEFLATLAHELRNPLAPIKMATHIVDMRCSEDKTMKIAGDTINRQVDHMVRLIDDLLDVSRITRGKLELKRERVELSTIVELALEASRPHIQAAGHELCISLPEEKMLLDADPVRIAQVLSNLLNNASKFTPQGGRIWLAAKSEGNEAIVTVKDTGIGLAAADIPKLFEMFTQLAISTERARSGLGIGLALARGLVEMHGGTITAGSDGPGMGSEFVVRLAVLQESNETHKVEEQMTAEQEPGCSRRILIADDNIDCARTLALALQLAGNETVFVQDGVEALQQAESFRPEVILLDLGMPKLDGYSVCREIRKQSWATKTQIIAITGWGAELDRERTKNAGFDQHLVKPADPQQILALAMRTR